MHFVALLVTAAIWVWPVPYDSVVRPFEAPAHDYGHGHRGLDLSAADGAEVRAPDDGVVRFAGTVAGRPVLSIDHGDGLISSFEPVVATVSEGDSVARGSVIGELLPGHENGLSLHLGARLQGKYVDPLPLLGRERPVLLPWE